MMQIINNINRIAGVKSTSKKPSTPVLYTKRTFASLTLRHRSSHTRFTLPSTVFIPSRSMMTRARGLMPNTIKNLNGSAYTTQRAVRFTGKKAAKAFSNDGSGKHPHIIEDKCIKTDCESKKCAQLCEKPNGFSVLGHNTHKPPIGRLTRFINSEDANGIQKPQYFVPNNTKKEFTEQEKQQHSNEIKPDTKQQTYITTHSDKYE